MARRSYGSGSTMSVMPEQKPSVSIVSVDADATDTRKESHSSKVVISVLVVALLVFGICSGFVFKLLSTNKVHASDAGDMASKFVTAVINNDIATLQGCFPDFVIDYNKSGAFIDDTNGTYYRGLAEDHGLHDLQLNVVSQDPQDLSFVTSTINDIYHIEPDVKEATSVRLTGNLITDDGYSDDNGNAISCTVVVCRIGSSLYVVPGLVEDESAYGFPGYPADDVSASVEDESDGATEDVAEVEAVDDKLEDTAESVPGSDDSVSDDSVMTIEYREEIIKPVAELKPYKKIMDDVKAGKVTIDEKEYDFPVLCTDLQDFVTLDYLGTGLKNTDSVEPNFIMNGVPVKFDNDAYDMVEKYFSVGNMTDKTVSVGEGRYTTVYLGYPKSTREYQVYDYPLVYLPGNVTFGTSYDDVVNLYGKLEKCYNLQDVPVYNDTTVTYQIELDHPHNYLYLQFDEQKLVGIEWYYFDFNNY